MLRVIIGSLIALVLVWFFAQSLGLTPQQAEDSILLAQLNEEAGLAYRQQYAEKNGVLALADELLVEVLQQGDGDIPDQADWISVHYQGWHVDGRLFESSYRLDVPGNVPLARTIPAWQRVLTQLPVGSRVRIVSPPELAYGSAGAGHIGPNETLIFEIELLDIIEAPQPVERDALQQPVPGL